MPVHWYYSIIAIKNDYGQWLTGYVAPKDKHRGSFMKLSDTDEHVVGKVILHNKLQHWTPGKGVHYHIGLQTGENTLNAVLCWEAISLLRRFDPVVTKPAVELRKAYMEHYIKFMTTPGSYTDPYAESCHRQFFYDWSQLANPQTEGQQLIDFCENRFSSVTACTEQHGLTSCGALALCTPWIVHYSGHSLEQCTESAWEAVKLTHPAPSLKLFVELYARLLHSVLNGGDLREQVLEVAKSEHLGTPNKHKALLKFSEQASSHAKGSEARLRTYQESLAIFGISCALPAALTSVLFLAYEFADDIEEGLLTNANCGGDSVHRGTILGSLIGAHYANRDMSVPQPLVEGLHNYKQYNDMLSKA